MGGYYNITYSVYYTIEELLEMLGVVTFIYSFLTYIETEYKQMVFEVRLGKYC